MKVSTLPPRLALIGLPWDENSSFIRGPAEAPPLIRAAFDSESANLWSETGIDFGAAPIFDAGDVEPISGVAMIARIMEAIAALLDQDYRPIALDLAPPSGFQTQAEQVQLGLAQHPP